MPGKGKLLTDRILIHKNLLISLLELKLDNFKSKGFNFSPSRETILNQLTVNAPRKNFTSKTNPFSEIKNKILKLIESDLDFNQFIQFLYDNFDIKINLNSSEKLISSHVLDNNNNEMPPRIAESSLNSVHGIKEDSLLKKVLIDPKFKLDSKQSIDLMQTLIELGQREAKKAVGKDLVLLLGFTGCGKSTMINYLNGCQLESTTYEAMKEKGLGKAVKVANTSTIPSVAEIGHGKISKTFMPSIIQTETLTLVDCPGFGDSRGKEISIINALNIKHFIKEAASIKLIFLVDALSIDTARGKLIKQLKKNSHDLLLSIQNNNYFPLIGVTKLDKVQDDDLSLESIADSLCDEDSELNWSKENVFIFDFFDKKEVNGYIKREQIIDKVQRAHFIPNSQSIVQTTLSDEDLQFLTRISSDITNQIEMLLKQNSIGEATKNLSYLKYLLVIEHSHINQLYENTLDKITIYLKDEKERIAQNITEKDFEKSEQEIKQFKITVEQLGPYRDFSSTLADLEGQLLLFKITLYSMQLNQLLNANAGGNTELAFNIYTILELETRDQSNLQIEQNLFHFLLLLNEVEPTSFLATKLIISLTQLALLSKNRQPTCITSCAEKVSSLIKESIMQVNRENERKIDEIQKQIKENINEFKDKAIWKLPGEKVLAKLNDLLQTHDKSWEANLMKVLAGLKAINIVDKPASRLEDCLHKLENEKAFLVCRTARQKFIGEIHAFLIQQRQELTYCKEKEIFDTNKQIIEGEFNSIQKLNWAPNQSYESLLQHLASINSGFSVTNMQNFTSSSTSYLRTLKTSFTALQKLSSFADEYQDLLKKLHDKCCELRERLETGKQNKQAEDLTKKVSNILDEMEKVIQWKSDGEMILNALVNLSPDYKPEKTEAALQALSKGAKDSLFKQLDAELKKLKNLSLAPLQYQSQLKMVDQTFLLIKKRFEEQKQSERRDQISNIIGIFLNELEKRITWHPDGESLLELMESLTKTFDKKNLEDILAKINAPTIKIGVDSIKKYCDELKTLTHVPMAYIEQLKTIHSSLERLKSSLLAQKQKLIDEAKAKLFAQIDKNEFLTFKASIATLEKLGDKPFEYPEIEQKIAGFANKFSDCLAYGDFKAANISFQPLVNLYGFLPDTSKKLKDKIQPTLDLAEKTIDDLKAKAQSSLQRLFSDEKAGIEVLDEGFKKCFIEFDTFITACEMLGKSSTKINGKLSEIINLCRTLIVESFNAKESKQKTSSFIRNLLIRNRTLASLSREENLRIEQNNAADKFIKDVDTDVIASIGNKLSTLKEHDYFGRYAEEILDKYPQFTRINIMLFKAKASRAAEDIFAELGTDVNSPLYESYNTYERLYKTIVSDLVRHFQQKVDTKQLEIKLINQAKENAAFLSEQENLYKHPNIVGELLACIFGVWSYIDAHSSNFLTDSSMLLQPHPAQVISVLLLLGFTNKPLDINKNTNNKVDETAKYIYQLQNHFLQVETGQGKSVLTAGAAVALALLGCTIHIACYSTYLAFRDETKFQPLFNKFDIAHNIKYASFGNLINNQATDIIGDLREIFKAFLAGNKINTPLSKINAKQILFIDEVDVFFSEAFLGTTYNPAETILDPDFQQLLRDIWEDNKKNREKWKDEAAAKANIRERALFKSFEKRNPNLHLILDIVLKDIWQALQAVANGKHKYFTSPTEGIGYEDELSGTIKYTTIYGYKTYFSYIESSNIIPEHIVNKHIGFHLSAGRISYTELPKTYSLILGVTGTLRSLTPYEQSIVRHYSINLQTPIPSIFEKKALKGEYEVSSPIPGKIDEDGGYFHTITQKIAEIVNNNRAVLVFFENEERLEQFKLFFDLKSSNIKFAHINVFKSNTSDEQKEFMVASSTARGEITLLSKAFGRGLDFICRDRVVREHGGVHVLQTFYSEHESEEIQIKGRTRRQDDPGSYEMILFLEDLKKFNINSYNDYSQFCATKGPATWYEFLKAKREEFQQTKESQLKASIASANKRYTKTKKFVDLMKGLSIFTTDDVKSNNEEEMAKIFRSFQL